MATIISKPAGEARERPRPAAHAQAFAGGAGGGGEPMRKSVGAAPRFDAASQSMAAAAEAPRGMISNPWVKHWAGVAAAPTTAAAAPVPAAAREARPAGAHREAKGEGRNNRTKKPGK